MNTIQELVDKLSPSVSRIHFTYNGCHCNIYHLFNDMYLLNYTYSEKSDSNTTLQMFRNISDSECNSVMVDGVYKWFDEFNSFSDLEFGKPFRDKMIFNNLNDVKTLLGNFHTVVFNTWSNRIRIQFTKHHDEYVMEIEGNVIIKKITLPSCIPYEFWILFPTDVYFKEFINNFKVDIVDIEHKPDTS